MRNLTMPLARRLVGSLIAMFLLLNPAAAFAQNATPSASPAANLPMPTFAIFPKGKTPGSPMDVGQKAGTTASYTVELINAGTKAQGPFKGRTFVTNANVRPNGGLQSGEPTDTPTGSTTWINYPTDVFTIEPGMGIERTFYVTVPKDTPAGQYVAAICFETADPLPVPGTPNLKQNLRKTMPIVINVPGKTSASFKIKDVQIVSDDTWTGLQATIMNTGNTLVKPAGTVTISDTKGQPLVNLQIGLGEYFAFRDGLLQIGIGGLVPNGDYLVTIDLHDDATGASATIEDQAVKATTMAQIEAANTPPVTFSSATGELKPSADKPQFLNVSATINNAGDPVSGAELSILAYKDGNLAEAFVLVSPLALPKGDTNVTSRYIPADGFSKGTWTFKLSVQVRDPKSGVATVLNTITLGNPVTIP